MALQGSGTISLSDLQNEYGGSNPISMSEYYRSGPYVNATTTVTVTNDSGWIYNTNTRIYSSYSWYDGSVSYFVWKWSGTIITNSNWPNSVSTYNTGGYTYYHGKYFGQGNNSTASIKRTWTSTSNTNVNLTVPSSGTVALSQYYSQGN